MLFKRIVYLLVLVTSFSANAANIAVVIDDIGYRKLDFAIYAMPQEIAVAIIPSAPYATARAKLAISQDRNILIHMPMQSVRDIAIEPEALKVDMTADDIQKLIDEAKRKVPYAIGLNNHMGSKATADDKLMHTFMDILSKENLAFLDSVTSHKSIAYKTAKQHKLNTLKRNIFLDSLNNKEIIRKRWHDAISYARKHGNAIVIGHPLANTISVLQEELAQLPADIKLIKIGELWGLEDQE